MLKGWGNKLALPLVELVLTGEQPITELWSSVDTQIWCLLEVVGVLHQGRMDKLGCIKHDNGTRPLMKGADITTLLAHVHNEFEAFSAKFKQITE